MKLQNDLVVFDLETTGLDKTNDHIIQFASIKIDKDSLKIKDKINLFIQPEGKFEISLQAYFKHGMNAKFLADKPYLKDVAKQIVDFFDDADVLTYNGKRFDIPFLDNALSKLGYKIDFINKNIYDSFMIETKRNGNKLTQTFERYYGKSMEDMGLKAHDAFSDVKATFGVFKAQTKNCEVEPEEIITVDGTLDYAEFRNEIVPCFTIGKYKWISVEFVAQIDQQYIKWCISDKCNFHQDTKNYIAKFIKE